MALTPLESSMAHISLHDNALLTAVLLITLAGIASAQGATLGRNCDLASQGANETATFLAFDHELRGALSKQDAGTTALLVNFPLRINDERGSFYIKDAASLQGRFEEIFRPAVRKAVLDQSPKTAFCSDAGIMYGDGVIWILRTERGYGVATVNSPTLRNSAQSTGYRVEFACQTDKDRIIVDQPQGSTLRYRTWHKPRSLLEKPDLEINKGVKGFQGSGACGSPRWSFTQGTTKVVVEGLGCSNGDQPEKAVGTVETTDKEVGSGWCF
jgi:hypothetical protein